LRKVSQFTADSWSCLRILGLPCLLIASAAFVQAPAPPQTPERPASGQALQAPAPTRANILRGEYGRYRANNDLLFYHLDVRVDPEKKVISGKNTIRFRMLRDDTRIQLDLYANLAVDRILLEGTRLEYERELNTVWVDFPGTLKAGRVYAIDFHYSGTPLETGRFGGFTFRKDPAGRHWITTSCEGPGASVWWPNKDQWRDEVERMEISVAIPNDLVDVSNGKFLRRVDLGDGYTRWDWLVQYPINSYNVSLNIGKYVQFSDRLDDVRMDFYVLPESLDKARRQFAQARPMLSVYEKVFGDYPFAKDGYKLIEVPYSGMEHQSAVTYGNRFANGYLERDWTGVGVSLKFDFIIIHESAHEWFGNSVSAADVSDMWIQEGWATYLEAIYVERMFGPDDAVRYINGYKSKILNRQPIVTARGIHRSPSSSDQYFKGALFIHTLRSVVNDDKRWWKLLRDFYQRFKYQNIMTEDVVRFFNAETGKSLTPLFDQYLRHTRIPTLELKFNPADGAVSYRWAVDVPGFAMPVRVGRKDGWQIVQATTEWQSMPTSLTAEQFEVATELYYVDVSRQQQVAEARAVATPNSQLSTPNSEVTR
jgi:aminopeptidase N